MKVVSYSQFSQWSTCPYKWKLNYIDNLREFKDNIHTLFGTSMHEVLQKYLTVMYTETIKAADNLDLNSMLVERMKENFKRSEEPPCTKEDMSEFYNHGTGHGLGLEIHTEPRMSQLSTQTLSENNVVTIEPGIYLPGWGGVRIEDDVIIKNDGCEIMNKTSKELVSLN